MARFEHIEVWFVYRIGTVMVWEKLREFVARPPRRPAIWMTCRDVIELRAAVREAHHAR